MSFGAQTSLSDPGAHARLWDAVGPDVPTIAAAVQGALIHDWMGGVLYEDTPAGFAEASRATLPASDRLAMIADGPFPAARPPAQRVVGTCRDFALLTTSALRHHGVPARVRCGFARYFHPPTFEDHWICEYLHADGRWAQVDAQLDAAHLSHLGLDFDPCDLPAGAFALPHAVWDAHGTDDAALMGYGHGAAAGRWFLHVNLARDALSLAGQETSLWDGWRDPGAPKACGTGLEDWAAAARRLERGEAGDFAVLEMPPPWL